MTATSIRVSEGSVFPGRPSSDSFQSWVALQLLAQERLALVSAFLGAAIRGSFIDRPFVKCNRWLCVPRRPCIGFLLIVGGFAACCARTSYPCLSLPGPASPCPFFQ